MSGAGGLLPLQPPQVLDDFRSLLLGPERVRIICVSGGQEPSRRVGGLAAFPVFESLEVEVDVGLPALVHR